jgi:rRNA maturation protein Nop10
MLLAEVRLTGDYVLSLCPECGDKVVVWNVKDPHFMNRKDAWKFMSRLEKRSQNWLNHSEVPKWA